MHMSNVLLEGPLGETLVRRLAGDDEFRTRFERNPVACLAEIGLSNAETLQLSPRCLAARALPSKEVLEQLLTDIGGEGFRLAMSFTIHQLRIQPSKGRAQHPQASAGEYAPRAAL
jgi:putative modified peptide